MFALIESQIIYDKAEKGIINFLVNPSAILENWEGEKPSEVNLGKVILNQRNLDLIKFLPLNIATAIKNPKREIIKKSLDGHEIVLINTAVYPQPKTGVCKIFDWGFRYQTGSNKGFWQFEWGRPLIRFCGRRNSFIRGSNGLFSYKPEEFKIIRLLTSTIDQPLIFQDTQIAPDEVVLATLEEERKEFYLPLRKRMGRPLE